MREDTWDFTRTPRDDIVRSISAYSCLSQTLASLSVSRVPFAVNVSPKGKRPNLQIEPAPRLPDRDEQRPTIAATQQCISALHSQVKRMSTFDEEPPPPPSPEPEDEPTVFGHKAAPRPSLIRPRPLEDGALHTLPAAPPINIRPRNASNENLEAKLDAMELQAKIAEKERLAQEQADKNKGRRASVLMKLDLEAGVAVPPPPIAPRPAQADDVNYQMEITAREQLMKSRKSNVRKAPLLSEEDEMEDEEVAFPLPKHGFENVMDRHQLSKPLDGLTADRIATLMEDVLFTGDSVKRAIVWMPSPGDIIVAAPPRCGQSLVVLMVRLLCANSNEEFEEILAVPSRTAPWIECSLVDDDPRVLERSQPGSNRIFRTTMANSMLSVKMDKCLDSKFISVFRNPIDLRIAWFDQLKDFYAKHQHVIHPERSEAEWAAMFEKSYSPDDIADTPLTMVQNTFHSADHTKEYEFNVRQWVQSVEERENCLMLFLEEILARPEKVLMKLATFLEKEVDPSTFERILEATTGMNVIKLSRRNSHILTPDQAALLRVKFGDTYTEGDGSSPEPSTSPSRPQNKRLEYLAQLEGSNQNISSRGIFAEIARKIESGPSRRSALTEQLAIGNQADLSPRTLELIRLRWADTFGSRGLTYEALYETMLGDPYPILKSTAPNPVEADTGFNPRKTIAKRLLKAPTDQSVPRNTDEVPNESDPIISGGSPGSRRTLVSRLFGKKKP